MGVRVVGAEAVGVEVDGAHAGGEGAVDIGADRVADVQRPVGGHAGCLQGDPEDRRVGLGHAHRVGVDHDRHRYPGPWSDLADGLGTEARLERPVGVRHDGQGHTGGGQGPQPVHRTGRQPAPHAFLGEGVVELGDGVVEPVVGHAGLGGVGPFVGGPQPGPDVALRPHLQRLRTGVVGPVEDGGIERPLDTGPPECRTDDFVVGEVEHPAHVQEDRIDLAAERPQS